MSRTAAVLFAAAVLALLSACEDDPPPPCPSNDPVDSVLSAGCLVVVHGSVLLVENRRGGFGPPGGSARDTESARCAAHRETWEETGLDLVPGDLVATFDTGFNLYQCAIHQHSGDLEIRQRTEISQIIWLPVDQFDTVEWRFAGQGEQLHELLTREQP